MINKQIDLYQSFKKERNGATGGFLTVYACTESKELKRRIHPCVLIIPGGGYSVLSDREGEPVALKYLNEGYIPFILSYSLKTKYPTPLNEVMLAMAYIRSNANEYNIDKDNVCVVGFSAGGHLAGLLATATNEEVDQNNMQEENIKPKAVILSYPVVTMGKFTHPDSRRIICGGDKMLYDKLSVEKRVEQSTPPTFIWHTAEDDCVPVENSLLLANSCATLNVPFALHIFEKGWHGLSTCEIETNDTEGHSFFKENAKWFNLSLDWLKSRGFEVKTSG